MIEKSATAITARRALVDRIDHYTAPEDLADAVIDHSHCSQSDEADRFPKVRGGFFS